MAGVIGILSSRAKMRPLMIILAAVALGLIFLGIVLTIVGYWPGYTAWGGNPLKYAGPILLGIGIIILVAVIADCCVRQELGESDDYERKEFVDFNSKSGATTPSVTVRGQYEAEVKEVPPKSAFRPISSENGYNPEVNVLTMMKGSPTRDRKYGNNYNQGNGIPTPTYPSDPSKKSVGYDAYTYSSDGNKMKLTSEQTQKSAPYRQNSEQTQTAAPSRQKSYEQMQYEQSQKSGAPYRQQPLQPIPAEGPRKWGSTEKILDATGGQTPPRSPKSHKNKGDPNQGIKLEKTSRPGAKYNIPTLHMPNFGRKTKDKSDKIGSAENSAPGSPDKVRRSRSVESKNKKNAEPASPTWGGHKKTKPVSNENKGWGSNNKEELSPVTGEQIGKVMQGPTESTPKDINNSREYNSSQDHSREYNGHYSDPQGHTSRRERERQHGRGYDSDRRRDRSSSGHRRPHSSSRHRSRSRERDSRARTRDDVYNTASIDYLTGATIRSDGRRSGRSRDRHGTSGRSRSHDRSHSTERSHGRSYDSDEHYRKHHRYPNEYQSSTSGSSRRDRRHVGAGVINPAYDRDLYGDDIISDDSHGLSPRHRPHLNHSNSTGGSTDDILKNMSQLALSPSNKKQTMNFTINVNAQPGSAVQIALGNQKLPPARPMLPNNVTVSGQDGDPHIVTSQLPHDNSMDTQSSSRSRTIRT